MLSLVLSHAVPRLHSLGARPAEQQLSAVDREYINRQLARSDDSDAPAMPSNPAASSTAAQPSGTWSHSYVLAASPSCASCLCVSKSAVHCG